jgi:hypothetical protein
MEGIEGDNEVEFFVKRQPAGVRHFESKIGPDSGTEVTGCEGDHVGGRIHTYNRPLRNTRSNFCRDFPIAASHIKDLLVPFEVEKGQHFFGHGLLQSR